MHYCQFVKEDLKNVALISNLLHDVLKKKISHLKSHFNKIGTFLIILDVLKVVELTEFAKS